MAMSLAELEELNNKKDPAGDPPAPATPIKSGDGNPTPADLQAAAAKAAADAAEAERNKGKTPEQLVEEQKSAHIAAGKNADGTEKTAEQKAADVAAQAVAEAEEEDDLAVWDEVDKLRGEPIKVEYKNAQGTEVHPNSPEGILIRERAIEDQAVARFEEHLATNDPRGYEYILHRQAGGTDEEFFSRKTVNLPPLEEFKTSVDLQVKVYSESLRIKGVPEKQIKMIVDAAVKDKEIEGLATTAYTEVQTNQDNEIKRLNVQAAQQREQYTRQVKALDKMLVEEINTGGGMKITIPDAKKLPFTDFVKALVQHDPESGQFFIGQAIDPKSMPRLLEALYLQFTNGNLGDLIAREATSQMGVRLRRIVKQADKPATGKDTPAYSKKTLGEL